MRAETRAQIVVDVLPGDLAWEMYSDRDPLGISVAFSCRPSAGFKTGTDVLREPRCTVFDRASGLLLGVSVQYDCDVLLRRAR